jgi:hypothetical protein
MERNGNTDLILCDEDNDCVAQAAKSAIGLP